MILTIIGSVFAAFQFVIAAAGAGSMDYEEYREHLDGISKSTSCDSEYNFACRGVMQCLL